MLSRMRLEVALAVTALASAANAQLPPVPFPPQNPITPAKAVLGKILFWDEQLSSDNTMACGTCHVPSAGGSDPRVGAEIRHPGYDEAFDSADDTFGSQGVVRSDADDRYTPDELFDLSVQVTRRRAPSVIGAAFFGELFWDGRASGVFVDPATQTVVIPTGGALENLVLQPLVSPVEMGHESRTFAEITAKLADVEPLRLADDLPPDVVSALAVDPTYPELFQVAFGSGEITAVRIAFAIATYLRTLVPNQTPWDAFVQGDQSALTLEQRQGLTLFGGGPHCSACHAPPLFSDKTFRNTGLRPAVEDPGRQLVTGNVFDRGKFKVPTLRNVALRDRFFHTGEMPDLDSVLHFYNGGGNVEDNQDPLVFPVGFSQVQLDLIASFLEALTDPRVANELPPFDRPKLHSERASRNPALIGDGVAGSGGFVPAMIAHSPPAAGVAGFRIGMGAGLGGASARLVISSPDLSLPGASTHSPLQPALKTVRLVLEGTGAGGGYQTQHLAIPAWLEGTGKVLHAQWLVQDPAAPGGVAKSRIAVLTLF